MKLNEPCIAPKVHCLFTGVLNLHHLKKKASALSLSLSKIPLKRWLGSDLLNPGGTKAIQIKSLYCEFVTHQPLPRRVIKNINYHHWCKILWMPQYFSIKWKWKREGLLLRTSDIVKVKVRGTFIENLWHCELFPPLKRSSLAVSESGRNSSCLKSC